MASFTIKVKVNIRSGNLMYTVHNSSNRPGPIPPTMKKGTTSYIQFKNIPIS
jgi:hypothetical protein